jgi:hypothetical protein
MNEFKSGDTVKCIRAGGTTSLIQGHEYTIARKNPDNRTHYDLVGDDNDRMGYFDSRFELVVKAVFVAALDLSKPLETKAGVPFTLLSANARGTFPVKGYVGNSNDLDSFKADGSYFGNGQPSTYDLRNVAPKPATAVQYKNVYKRADGTLFALGGYDTVAEADDARDGDHVGRMKLTMTEGVYEV